MSAAARGDFPPVLLEDFHRPPHRSGTMRQTELTNDEEHNARFLKSHLRRYHGDAKLASRAAGKLAEMGEHGQAWWRYIEAQCIMRHLGVGR